VKSRVEFPPSAGDSAENVACPICLEPHAIAGSPGRDRLFKLAQGFFPLFRCVACGCIFQHPFPEDRALAQFYPQKYWWAEGEKQERGLARWLRRLEKVYREFVVADHVRFLDSCALKNNREGKQLLDIGCGGGTFLHVAQSHGFIPHGMDQSAEAVDIASRQYGYPVRQGEIGSRIWEERRFDFVTMFHVLEHLSNPRQGLKFAGDLLRPGGVLIVQVPNAASVQARLFGNRWHGLDVPRHVINYTPRSLGFLLRDMGFEYSLIPRFSLRDNPASIASSLAAWLDPIGRKALRRRANPLFNGVLEIAYLGVFLLALPPAFLESAFGFGGTLWACARKKEQKLQSYC